MNSLEKAKEPFRLFTRLNLSELTGLRAVTLGQLVGLIKTVPGACIYHHTHKFLQQHQYLSPEPPNDFAYWVSQVLGEERLGEQLASIDTIQFSTIRGLREEIARTIDFYLENHSIAKIKFTRLDEAFHFIKSISFVMPTKYVACDLLEFLDVFKKITFDSIYFHIFEARLRLEKGKNDFSNWIECALGDLDLAVEISRLDPYSFTSENLRKKIISIIERRMDSAYGKD